MGFYDGMSTTPAAGDSSQINPGLYPAVLLKNVKYLQGGYFGSRTIYNFTVLAPGKENPSDPGDNIPTVLPAPVGSTASVAEKEGEKPDEKKRSIGRVKAATSILMGHLEGQADLYGADVQAMAERAVTPEQPLRGKIVALEAKRVRTRGNNVFLKWFLRPADPQLAASLAITAATELAKADEESPVAAAVPPPAAPPPPPVAPAAPPPPWTLPVGWYAFPVGDPREGKFYNASHEVRTRAELGG